MQFVPEPSGPAGKRAKVGPAGVPVGVAAAGTGAGAGAGRKKGGPQAGAGVSRKDDFVKNKEKAKRKLGQSSMVSSPRGCWQRFA